MLLLFLFYFFIHRNKQNAKNLKKAGALKTLETFLLRWENTPNYKNVVKEGRRLLASLMSTHQKFRYLFGSLCTHIFGHILVRRSRKVYS